MKELKVSAVEWPSTTTLNIFERCDFEWLPRTKPFSMDISWNWQKFSE